MFNANLMSWTTSSTRRRTAATVVAAVTVLGVASSWDAQPSTAAPQRERVATADGLFPNTAPRRATQDPETTSVELGVQFRASKAGAVTGAQVYKIAKRRGKTPTSATLWNARGKALATAEIAPHAGAGWVQVDFATSVPVKVGKLYTISVFAPKGRYAVTEGGLRKPAGNKALRTVRKANGVYAYADESTFPTRSHRSSNYWVDVVFARSTKTGQPTATPTPTPAPTPTPTPTPAPGGFPSAANTGVPAGVELTAYTGPMNITTPGTVVDAKSITGSLTVSAANVTITRSSVVGSVGVEGSGTLAITDTMIDAGNKEGTGLGEKNFTATRIHVVGGNRSINCANDCTVQDSYVHGQFKDTSGYYHESGIRMGINSTLLHNTISCDAPDVAPEAGCSAPLTGYGDFEPVQNNLIQGNLFKATPAYFCAYGGSSAGKSFSDDARDIRFIGNVFERGTTGKCGRAGPVTDFDESAPGNVWESNTYDNGAVARP